MMMMMMMMMSQQQQQHREQQLQLSSIVKVFVLRFSFVFFLFLLSLNIISSAFTIHINNKKYVVLTTTTKTTSPCSSNSNHRRNTIGTKLQEQLHQQQQDHVYEPKEQKVGLYIHIPYCQKRCYYCNFDIIPIGTTTSSSIQMMSHSTGNTLTGTNISNKNPRRNDGFDKMNELYVQTLIKELDLIHMQRYLYIINNNNNNTYNNTYNKNQNNHKKNKIILRSIYFGGGTPSLLPIKSLQYIMNHIKTGSNNNDMNRIIYNDDTYNNHNNTVSFHNNYNYNMFQLQNDTKLCEVTIEIDPNTNHNSNELQSQIQFYKNIGINRFSFGIQSFDNTILQNLGRTHTTNDIYNLLHILTGNSSSHNNRSSNSINQNQHNEQPQDIVPLSSFSSSSSSILSDSQQQPSQSMNRSRTNTKSIITTTSTTNNNDDYDTTSPTITIIGANINNNNNNHNNSHSIINYSIDLICGMVPGLTITKWMETLYNATTTTRNQHQNEQNHNHHHHHHHHPIYQLPTHFSIYDLQIEDRTIYGKLYSKYRDDDEVIDNDDADNNNENDKLSPTKQTLVATTSRASLQQSSSSSSSSKMIQQQQTNVNYKVGYKNKLNNAILPSYQDAAFMYKYTSGYLRAKHYEHYEISSYAYIPPSVSSSSTSSTNTIETNELINVENTTCTNQNVIEVREEQQLSSLQSPYRSQHNQIYWGYNNISSWYAIGLGATSYVHGKIMKRPKTMYEYIQWVNTQYNQTYNEILNYVNNNNYIIDTTTMTTNTNLKQVLQSQSISDFDNDNHNMMMIIIEEIKDIVLKRLRTSDGLLLEYIQEQYGQMYVNAIEKGIQFAIDYNMAIITSPPPTTTTNHTNNDNNNVGNHTILRLTDPIGFLYSNTIISNIFYELDDLK